MGKLRGFLEHERAKPADRPIVERLRDWREFSLPLAEAKLRDQGARCMDCGIPFCHEGCPLGNLIPDWNDHVYNGRWDAARRSLESTNNFPEVTSRVCPAPCEASCVLNIENVPVTIKTIERAISDRSLDDGRYRPQPARHKTGKHVVVIGSGPAGLAAAQQLARRGHSVTVLEQADRLGGLLRYGIPDFKMEKSLLDLRIEQMQREGVTFKTNVRAGVDVDGGKLLADYDAIVLAGGAMKPRDLTVPGRELGGIHFAMDFLTQQNRRVAGDKVPASEAIVATGKRVVVLGGGDTGSDCVGTSLRQQAAGVTSLELMPRPPDVRLPSNPWPEWPLVYRTSSSHEEGGTRDFAIMTKRFLGSDGKVTALEAVHVELRDRKLVELPGTELTIPCELVLLAMGFTGPVSNGLFEQLGVQLNERGNVATRNGRTNVPNVFAAGDMARGQSLVVWAISEGRKAAAAVDSYLLCKQEIALNV